MRKTKQITIEHGEDKGKTYVLTRMSAWDADIWAQDVLQEVLKATPYALNDIARSGLGALLPYGEDGERQSADELLCGPLFAHMSSTSRNALFSRMWVCVQIKAKTGDVRDLEWDMDDIVDPKTIVQLRLEVFKLHLDFIKAEASQISPFGNMLTSIFQQALGPKDK